MSDLSEPIETMTELTQTRFEEGTGMTWTKIRPIRNEEDYHRALAAIDSLIDATEDSPESEMLEVISVIVADYEDKHHAIEAPDPIAFLEFIMESRRLTRK